MRVKRFNGKPYGAEFTAAERKAMLQEINRQIVEKDEQYAADIDALILYVLMTHYGWKKKRLKQFWKVFVEEHAKLREFFGTDDTEWFAHKMLRDIGVDVHQWYKEEENE